MRAGKAVAATVVLVALHSSADDAPVRAITDAITVEKDDCLTTPALSAEVARWLGRDSIDARIDVTVRAEGGQVVIVPRRSGTPMGERRFPRAPCDHLTSAVALGIALTIDATLLERLGQASASASASTSAPVPPPTAPSASASAQPPAERPIPGVVAHANGSLIVLLPSATFALDAGLTMRVDPIEIRASFLFTPATADFAVGTGNVSARLFTPRLDGCFAKGRSVRYRSCVGVAGGGVFARGSGFPIAQSTTMGLVVLALHGDVLFAVTRAFGIAVALDLMATLVRPKFEVVDESGIVVSSASALPVGIMVGAGPTFSFP